MMNFRGFNQEDFDILTKMHPDFNFENNNRFNLPMLSNRFLYSDANGTPQVGHELNNIIMKNENS